MQTVINMTRNPIVVADDSGKRHVIKPRGSIEIDADLSNHRWVKAEKLAIGVVNQKSGSEDDSPEGADELAKLRLQFQNIFGEKPHGNLSAETLRKKIEEWQNQGD